MRREPVSRDVDDFARFVAARSSALLRTACFLTGGDRQTGEDLLQEAFAETYRRWPRITDPSKREAYLGRILVRSATRRWRKASRHHLEAGVVEPHQPVDEHADDVVRGVDVWAFLADLPARQRAVIVLRYYEDMSEAAIGEVLGCAPGTVKSHAHRALRTLERNLRATDYMPVDQGGGFDGGASEDD